MNLLVVFSYKNLHLLCVVGQTLSEKIISYVNQKLFPKSIYIYKIYKKPNPFFHCSRNLQIQMTYRAQIEFSLCLRSTLKMCLKCSWMTREISNTNSWDKPLSTIFDEKLIVIKLGWRKTHLFTAIRNDPVIFKVFGKNLSFDIHFLILVFCDNSTMDLGSNGIFGGSLVLFNLKFKLFVIYVFPAKVSFWYIPSNTEYIEIQLLPFLRLIPYTKLTFLK